MQVIFSLLFFFTKGLITGAFGCTKSDNPPFHAQSSVSNNNYGKVVIGYWTDWHEKLLSYEKIPFEYLTHIHYAFGTFGADYKVHFFTKDYLEGLTQSAHAHNIKVIFSIGGWTDSAFFSPMVADSASRANFVKDCLGFVEKYFIDGIDLDWEHPGRLGDNCNKFDPVNDTSNLLLLLQELRAALPAEKEISLAVGVTPFDGVNGPLSDVSQFADYIDRLNIMVYDLSGPSWSPKTASSAPMRGMQSVMSAFEAWTSAGIPVTKLCLGVPFYGRAWTLLDGDSPSTNGISNEHVKGVVPKGDKEDVPSVDQCAGPEAVFGGVWNFRNLIAQGILTGPKYDQAISPWKRGYDNYSETAYVWNRLTKQFITYDDPTSLEAKVNYAKSIDSAGIMFWEMSCDDQTEWPLLNSLQNIRGSGEA
ncbi:Chitinase A1 [Neolecta irregularis DAH-3]|uniref:chitinase n=1 Tax=Neolecta irregularis (strain DAH-3) TaxID=1198029 RepID=A0A1U7LLT3_NEOID|nr:Chitinase A1 [Neolecta irregularis DAH-3]|eukprot:OLL23502.1 Chitinase A1 [Neolecta irregularis DAH-3]